MKTIISLLIIALALLSCSSFEHPPNVLQKTKCLANNFRKVIFFDIDKNGVDEIVILGATAKKTFVSKIRILDFPGFMSRLEFPFPYYIEDFNICDIDGKGNYFLVITSKDSNHTYVETISFTSDDQHRFPKIPVSEGYNTFNNDNDLTWDGGLTISGFFDLNHDGYKEAILRMQALYDYGERGIAVLDIRNNRLLWKFPTGSSLGDPIITDINNDGVYELFFDSYSPRNGLEINGMDDNQPYYLVLDETGQVLFKEIAGKVGAGIKTSIYDVDADGQKEIIMVYSGSWSATQINSHLNLLEWGEKEGEKIRDFPGGIESSVFLPGYTKNTFNFVFIPRSKKNELHIFNDKLEQTAIINMGAEFSALYPSIDIDGDGKNEFKLGLYRSGKKIYVNSYYEPIAWSVPFKDLFRYKVFQEGRYQLYGLTSDHEFWELDLRYDWARWKPLGIVFGIILPWILIVILVTRAAASRQRNKRSPLSLHYLDHLHSGIVFINRNNQVTFINKKARQLLQIKIPDLPVRLKLIIEKMPADLAEKIEKALNNREAFSFDFTLGSGELKKHLLFNVVSSHADDKHAVGTLITIEDLTKIVNSQRSISFAALTQHLAHDIKNPLSNVRLVLERMKLDCAALPEKEREKLENYVQSIEKDIKLVRGVTDSFMQFSSLSKPNPAPVLIPELLDEIISKRLPLLQERITFEKNFFKDDIRISIDAGQITRAIDNILDNAIRAIPEKGTIIISTRLSERVDRESGLEKKYLEIEIEDSGKGIDPDMVENVFEPFVSRTRGGTGLGLAIVKKIIEDHGGSIKLNSAIGVGTRILIVLPAE